MSRTVGDIIEDGYCFPRVSGDEPHGAPPPRCGIAFSPRERG